MKQNIYVNSLNLFQNKLPLEGKSEKIHLGLVEVRSQLDQGNDYVIIRFLYWIQDTKSYRKMRPTNLTSNKDHDTLEDLNNMKYKRLPRKGVDSSGMTTCE